MRIRIAGLIAGAFLGSTCGGGEDRSPREACTAAEETINAAALECNPQFTGTIDLSCQNFGTGESCEAIDAYFECVMQTTCSNGMIVLRTDCQLGACQ